MKPLLKMLLKLRLAAVFVVNAALPLGLQAQAASPQTFVIATYGGAALVAPVQQLLNQRPNGGRVVSYQDQLIVTTTNSNYQAVKDLLLQIDQQPKPLIINVRVGGNAQDFGQINQGQISIDRRGVYAQGGVYQSSTQSTSSQSYQVQTLSGYPASLSTATLLALSPQRLNQPNFGQLGLNQVVINQIGLVTATQGINVIPRLLNNNQVEVTLQQNNDKVVQSSRLNSPIINQQSLAATLIVSRGTWQKIGEIQQRQNSSNSEFNQNGKFSTSNQTPIWLMIQ